MLHPCLARLVSHVSAAGTSSQFLSVVNSPNSSDLKNWELAARNIAKVCTSNKIIVEKSTVPVKTAEALRRCVLSPSRTLISLVVSLPSFVAHPFPPLLFLLLANRNNQHHSALP